MSIYRKWPLPPWLNTFRSKDMIVHDIRQAQQRQDKPHILTLLHVLHHFLKSHPEVCPPQHPWSQLY
jgi:hypothetical protein